MANKAVPNDHDEDNADATTGGGATADRGGRDAGLPGPDPNAGGAGVSKRFADSAEGESPEEDKSDPATPAPHSVIDDATSAVTSAGPSS